MPDIEKLRTRLLARREELRAMAGSDAESAAAVELDQSRVGRLSRMDALQQQAMSIEEQRLHQLELGRIDAALQRMDTGEYGDCLRCGEPIAEARLEADPSAVLCIACAEQAEQQQ